MVFFDKMYLKMMLTEISTYKNMFDDWPANISLAKKTEFVKKFHNIILELYI